MNLRRVFSRYGLPAIAVGTMIFVSSCRPMITPQQLQELTDLRTQEKSLTEQIQNKKGEITKIKGEISSREAELKKCTEESDFVKQKLSSWPNSWPDWQPEQPAEEPIGN